MKLSVSVPDQLWAAVYRAGDSPSVLVQQGIELLAATSRGEESPFPHAPAGFDTSRLEESRRKLADEARELARAGYEIGVETAAGLPWSKLERLAGVMEIAEWLLEEDAVNDLDREDSSPFLLEVWDRMQRHPLAETFDLERSPTVRQGVGRGLLDMRSAVLRDLGAAAPAAPDVTRAHVSGASASGMHGSDVADELLAIVVGLLPGTFRTKDVSEHPEMRAALARFEGQRQYHAIVGRRLSAARALLGITEIAKGGARGSTWQKVGA